MEEKIYYYYVLKYIDWVDEIARVEGVISVDQPITSLRQINELKDRIRGDERKSSFSPLRFEVLSRL